MIKACFFAGNRDVQLSDELDKALDKQLLRYIRNGITRFYTGAERGWDMMCAMRVLRLKHEYPQLELFMVIPCPPELHSAGCSFEEQFVYNTLYHHADSVEQLFGECRFDGTARRNRRLAESCSHCLCYLDGKVRGSIAQAVAFAQETGLQVDDISRRRP